MNTLRALAALTAGSLVGLGLSWLSVFYLLPELDDLGFDFDAPHLKAQLRIHM